jgi:hypothetical protein
MSGTCRTHGRGEIFYTIFWLENLKVRDHSEDLGVDGKVILECILGKWGGGKLWTGCICVRIGTSGGPL